MLNDVSKTGAKVRPRPLETNAVMDQLKLQIDRVRLFLNSSLVKTLGSTGSKSHNSRSSLSR